MSPEPILKGFKNFCLQSAMYKTDVQWNDSEEECQECHEDYSTDCEDGDSDTGKGRYKLT